MLFFVLAIVFSALISILMRASGKYVRNRTTMLAFNYAMCAGLSILMTGAQDLVPQVEGIGFTVTLGLINGFLYLGGFALLQWNMGKNGVVLSATFMKLGVLVPTLMGLTIFGEVPSVAQVFGILAAVCAIILIQFEKGHGKAGSLMGLLLMLAGGGLGDGMSKVYETFGNPALGDHFLLYTFLMALLLCSVLCIVQKQSITLPDMLFGLLIGIPNYLSSLFLLKALDSIPAIVAYPGFSVGAIVLVTLAGCLLFHEKLSRRQWAALGVILAALVLLNL